MTLDDVWKYRMASARLEEGDLGFAEIRSLHAQLDGIIFDGGGRKCIDELNSEVVRLWLI